MSVIKNKKNKGKNVFLTETITNDDIFRKLNNVEQQLIEHTLRVDKNISTLRWNVRFQWFIITILATGIFWFAQILLKHIGG